MGGTIDVSSSSSSYGGSNTFQSQDSSEFPTIKKQRDTPDAKATVEKQEDTIANMISTEFSWFSILWTCQKQQALKKEDSNKENENC